MQSNLAEGVALPLNSILLNGQMIDIHFNQGQPILLHFWATWRPVCKMEEDSIKAISEDHKVFTIAMQSGGDQDTKVISKNERSIFP